MISLKDKVVIITGGGRGIGFGLSTAFAKAGAKLVIT
ncbi:MAG: short-chain dehydrogenase, partial [Clostridiales bacterium]|nr:short-chain dehydrogenase [Clostridiales bacterium]